MVSGFSCLRCEGQRVEWSSPPTRTLVEHGRRQTYILFQQQYCANSTPPVSNWANMRIHTILRCAHSPLILVNTLTENVVLGWRLRSPKTLENTSQVQKQREEYPRKGMESWFNPRLGSLQLYMWWICYSSNARKNPEVKSYISNKQAGQHNTLHQGETLQPRLLNNRIGSKNNSSNWYCRVSSYLANIHQKNLCMKSANIIPVPILLPHKLSWKTNAQLTLQLVGSLYHGQWEYPDLNQAAQ